MIKLSLPLLCFLVLTLFIIPVLAQEEDVNLVNFPTQLAAHWGISTFAAGLFLSSLLAVAFLFPFMLWKKSGLMIVMVGFSVMGFCIAIGWLPYWIMLMLSLLIASMFAGKITKGL